MEHAQHLTGAAAARKLHELGLWVVGNPLHLPPGVPHRPALQMHAAPGFKLALGLRAAAAGLRVVQTWITRLHCDSALCADAVSMEHRLGAERVAKSYAFQTLLKVCSAALIRATLLLNGRPHYSCLLAEATVPSQPYT